MRNTVFLENVTIFVDDVLLNGESAWYSVCDAGPTLKQKLAQRLVFAGQTSGQRLLKTHHAIYTCWETPSE